MSGPGLKVGYTLKHLQSVFSRALVLARFMFRVCMDPSIQFLSGLPKMLFRGRV